MIERRSNRAWIPIALFAILLVSLAASPAGSKKPRTRPSDPVGARLEKVLSLLIGEEAVSQGAYQKLAYLTDRIGPRLSGSPGAAEAVAWTAAEFKRDGLAVRTEKIMVPHWVRGEEKAEVLAPYKGPVAVTALGMSIPTPPGGVTGDLVEVTSFEELKALGARVRGKIVLYYKPVERLVSGDGYGPGATLRYKGAAEAGKLGAVAMLIRSLGTLSARLPHTGGQAYVDGVDPIPAAAIAAEDADRIHRILGAGDTVRLRLTLGCRTLPDAESANVVAELRGRARPDEIVVIGGHLDSWDLGTGAIDDGAGVAVSMEALRLLKKLDLVPRRTIRAVLFMNEENGNRGGKGYFEAHKEEMGRHLAAIESDSGAGRPLGFQVLAGEGGVHRVTDLASHLESQGATDVLEGEGGVDISPMRAAGVPQLSLRQDMSDYFHWHHTAADTLDKVDPRLLADNAVAMAFMAYALAELDPPLARVPESKRAEKTR